MQIVKWYIKTSSAPKKQDYRKVEGKRNYINQENINQKKVEVSKLPLEKVDLQTKTICKNNRIITQ